MNFPIPSKLIYADHLLEELDHLLDDDRAVGFLDPQWIRLETVEYVIDHMPAVCPVCKAEVYNSSTCPNCGERILPYEYEDRTLL